MLIYCHFVVILEFVNPICCYLGIPAAVQRHSSEGKLWKIQSAKVSSALEHNIS